MDQYRQRKVVQGILISRYDLERIKDRAIQIWRDKAESEQAQAWFEAVVEHLIKHGSILKDEDGPTER